MTTIRSASDSRNINLDCISVCICTFKRPAMLRRVLDGIIAQTTGSEFTFEIIVVDNDEKRSAENIVAEYKKAGQCQIIYDCEPEQGIPLARNRTIRIASGNFIAIIDDDEFPAENWLHEIYLCIKKFNVDGVLGPVLPHFPPGAPLWLKKSGLCNRPRNITGSPITGKDFRTGNVLFQRHVFGKDDMWFDPARRLTGGSDGEFLSRQIMIGRKFIWCDEAIVFEIVPEERWPTSYYLKRQFRIGTMAGRKIRQYRKMNIALKTILLILGYSAILPFATLKGKHVWMKVLTKLYYNVACLRSFFKLTDVQQR